MRDYPRIKTRMAIHEPLTLIDRLRTCAALWADANDRSLGALASVVMNHGSFFDRFESADVSTTTTTLERFARFLGDPANWPEAAVPDAVREFVHVVGITPDAPTPATGQSAETSGQSVAERAA